MSEISYFFNARGDVAWTDPDNIVDNNLGTFGYTDNNGQTQVLNGNDCPGTDLGTITKVELRVYAYGDGDDRIDIVVFGYQTVYKTTPGTGPPGTWGAYVDITNHPDAPSPWTWADIVAQTCGVMFAKVAKANTMHCAKVEIRVTYTPVGPPAKVTQYLPGNDCPEFPHEMDLMSDKLPCPPPYD